jgi:hypothetical protein
MPAPGLIRCRACQRDQRPPRPYGFRDETGRWQATEWVMVSCLYCGFPIVRADAPVRYHITYAGGWPARTDR